MEVYYFDTTSQEHTIHIYNRHLLGPIRGVTKLLCLQATESTEIVSYSLLRSVKILLLYAANLQWV